MTVHVSKGLEFPVVYVPFAWDRWVPDTRRSCGCTTTRDGGCSTSAARAAPATHRGARAHLAEESRRGPAAALRGPHPGPLPGGRALGAERQHRRRAAAPAAVRRRAGRRRASAGAGSCRRPPTTTRGARSTPWPRGAGGTEVAERDARGRCPVAPATRRPRRRSRSAGSPARWTRTGGGRRTARSPRAARAATGSASRTTPGYRRRATTRRSGCRDAGGRRRCPSSPLSELPGGAAFGTLVHAVLEDLDPDRARPDAGCAERASRAHLVPGVTAEALADGAACRCCATPLGPLAGGRRWPTSPPADRLAELDFELPLAGGDDAVAARARSADVVDAAAAPPARRRPARRATRPLAARARRQAAARVTSPAASTRCSGCPGRASPSSTTRPTGSAPEPLTTWHYRPEAMAEEMLRAHYPLQALLYCVALHRYLRWRLPGLRPGAHLGPCALPVRPRHGGPRTPARRRAGGVLAGPRRPALVAELSDLLAGQRDDSDRVDPRPPRRRGCSASSTEAGVLDAADVHVALPAGPARRRAATRPVLLAVALAVRGVRAGSVCVELATGRRVRGARRGRAAGRPDRGRPDWTALAGQPAGRRRRRRARGGRCGWSTGCSTSTGTGSRSSRSARDARRARRPARRPPVDLRRRCARCPTRSRRPPTGSGWRPRVAAARWISVLTGGPGTGKTTTVARLLAAAARPARSAAAHRAGRTHRQGGRPAAGGGAGTRPARGCGPPRDLHGDDAAPAAGLAARQPQPLPARPRQPLPYDVVVVDESSMVSLTHDGPAARGAAADGPAGAGRRPRPADARSRPARCSATWCTGPHRPATRTASRRSRRRRSRPRRRGPPAAAQRRRPAAGVAAVRRRHRRAGRGGAAGDADRVLDLLDAGTDLALDPARRRWRRRPHRRGRHACRRGGGRRGALPGAARPRIGCCARTGTDRSASPRGTTASAGSPARRRGSGGPAPAARDRERLREPAVQRRHRRRRPDGWTGSAGGFRPGDGPICVPLSRLSAVEPGARDDGAPQPGQPVRAGHRAAAAGQSPLLTRELLYTAVAPGPAGACGWSARRRRCARRSHGRWCARAACGGAPPRPGERREHLEAACR